MITILYGNTNMTAYAEEQYNLLYKAFSMNSSLTLSHDVLQLSTSRVVLYLSLIDPETCK